MEIFHEVPSCISWDIPLNVRQYSIKGDGDVWQINIKKDV